MPERPPMEYPIPSSKDNQATVSDIWYVLREAAVDSRIRAWCCRRERPNRLGQDAGDPGVPGRVSRNPASRCTPICESPGMREYYWPAPPTRIYTAPEDFLDMKGLRLEIMFFHNTLDKLGVQVEDRARRKVQGSGDMFVRESMSPETREVIEQILDQFYGSSFDRRDGAEKVARGDAIHHRRRPVFGDQDAQEGLVDALLYEDGMFAR